MYGLKDIGEVAMQYGLRAAAIALSVGLAAQLGERLTVIASEELGLPIKMMLTLGEQFPRSMLGGLPDQRGWAAASAPRKVIAATAIAPDHGNDTDIPSLRNGVSRSSHKRRACDRPGPATVRTYHSVMARRRQGSRRFG